MAAARKPTITALERAADVLGWLHEQEDDGADRDEISRVRSKLLDEIENRERGRSF